MQLPDFTQSFNRYTYALNNPFKFTDPDGELFWLIPVAIGAGVGAYMGASIQSGTLNPFGWQQDAWKGAIVGAFVGATAGAFFSAAFAPSALGTSTGFHTTGMLAGGHALPAWGITTTSLQSASINIGTSYLQGKGVDGAWKAGIVGAASGAWTASGGIFGIADGNLLAKLTYQNFGMVGRSIGRNWVNTDEYTWENLTQKIVFGAGPINFNYTRGKGFGIGWQDNIGNLAFNSIGLLNYATGGEIRPDWSNLTLKYSGGFIEKGLSFFDVRATGAYTVYSRRVLRSGRSPLPHELRHVWQSRSMGDSFIPNYFFQGLFPVLMGRSQYHGNYFEQTAEYGF